MPTSIFPGGGGGGVGGDRIERAGGIVQYNIHAHIVGSQSVFTQYIILNVLDSGLNFIPVQGVTGTLYERRT